VGDFETGDYGQWDGIQAGRNYAADGSWTLRKTPAQQMPLVSDTVRQGHYAAHVVLDPGDYAYSTSTEAALALRNNHENEGSNYYYGFSLRFPTDWRGSNGWGTVLEWQAKDWYNYPSYGVVMFDAGDPNRLQLIFHTGKTPDRGAASYDPAYNQSVDLLNPLPKGVWLDFIVHDQWAAHGNGAFTVWYRPQGTSSWTKLYDNTGAGDARVNRPPHPTWMYNSLGTPEALTLMGYYSAATPWTRSYWFDNVVRSDTFDAVAPTFG
jgi:hypothetical protein